MVEPSLFQNKAGGHIVLGKVDDGRAFVNFEKSLFAENFYLSLNHYAMIEGFALVAESNVIPSCL